MPEVYRTAMNTFFESKWRLSASSCSRPPGMEGDASRPVLRLQRAHHRQSALLQTGEQVIAPLQHPPFDVARPFVT